MSECKAEAAVYEAFAASLMPPPLLSLSEWANTYGILSRETSAQTGRFKSFAYQDGIMDAISSPSEVQVTVMKSARVGFTRILDHAIGYYIAHEPSPILVVQPRSEDCEDFSKTEIAPMLRDTPALAAIVGDLKARDSSQTILKKSFTNGASLSLVGANSPNGFRRITIRVLLMDEVDGWPAGGAGSEGDQVALGIKRTETFWDRRIVLGSTPTIKGISRIEKEWLRSDQRRFFVPCPHCGEKQFLTWGGKDTAHGMKWDKGQDGTGQSETAYYVCVNGCIIHDVDKPKMVEQGEWRATNPKGDHAGFHIWAGYSLFVNAAWPKLVAEWLRVKDDPLARQTFINLVLGEPYEDRGDHALSERRLAAQTEVWPAEVPDGVAMLTAGADVQSDRVEVEIVGWGRNEERWSIAHGVIEGDPDTEALWDEVDALLKRRWTRADGRQFEIMAACIDSGGHHTQRVYGFCKARLGRRIWAIKGESARGGARSPVWPTKRPSARNKATFRPVIIGVNAAKDVIRNRLHLLPPPPGEALPGYMHYPADRDMGFFAQLVSERSVTKQVGGQRYRVWELPPGRANEALDLAVYSYAALCGLLHMGVKLNKRADGMASPAVETPDTMPDAPAAEQQLSLVQSAAPPATATVAVHLPPGRRSLASRLA